ncbi:hypothetical protein ACSSV4_003796 [Roseovarius sp. MBR-154]|jgi:hypothetical protein
MYAFVSGCLVAVCLAVAAWFVFDNAAISAVERANTHSVVIDAGSDTAAE